MMTVVFASMAVYNCVWRKPVSDQPTKNDLKNEFEMDQNIAKAS